MVSRIHTAVCRGIEGVDVYVETDIERGLPGIYIVGLASTMVMESRERIKSAIMNSGLDYPRGRITVSLTPASLRKNGSGLDLPIAIGVLTAAMSEGSVNTSEYGIIGELSLEGCVLGVNGVLPMVICLKKSGMKRVIIPQDNVIEASLVSGIEIYPVRTLSECMNILCSDEEDLRPDTSGDVIRADISDAEAAIGDFADICGQENAKRALTIAVTGRHGILMIGSPGCGKTMLASRLPSVMPPMSEEELIETAVIYSAAGRTNSSGDIPLVRPFRNPHSTIGRAGLIGGGLYPVPGEITLAHNGVLFMDEVCEFETGTIEALRTPIEEKRIVHFRKGESYVFPCDFQLVMASNPCPCGFFGDSKRMCKCTESQLERYRKKLSGPMMDRIDIRIAMENVEYEELRRGPRASGASPGASGSFAANAAGSREITSTKTMREAVARGNNFALSQGRKGSNASLSDADIDKYCALGRAEERFMKRAYDALKMTPRSYKKTLKVARTIADLECSKTILEEHLAEALSYRMVEAVNE